MPHRRRKNKNRHGSATQHQPHSPAAGPTTTQEHAQEPAPEQQQASQVAHAQEQVVATEEQQQQQQQQPHETDDMQVESEQHEQDQREHEQDEQLTQLEAQEQTEEPAQAQEEPKQDDAQAEPKQEAAQEQTQEPAEAPADESMQDESEEQREQHQQSEHELTKLRAIETKVQQIHDKLTTRMPLQRKHLAARVCGAIWAARVRLTKMRDGIRDNDNNNSSTLAQQQQQEQQRELYNATVKKLRMELGAFDYQAKEQGELLTRHLCDLDDILSFGNTHVKDARKALVVFIQRDALPLADALRDQSARLKAFGEALIATLPQPDAETKTPVTPTADPVSTKSEPRPTANEAAEGSDTENKDMNNNDDDDGTDDGDDEASDAFATKRAAPPSPPHQRLNHHHHHHQQYQRPPAQEQPHSDHQQQPQHQHVPPQYRRPMPPHQQKPAAELEALPVWRPYYQLQKRRDGLYLIAKLHDVEPANLHVQWNDRVGVLRLSGHKLPTQKDIMVSRFSGVPTFGRFDILERLPAESLAMDHATQKLYPDGTLEIRMPYYVAPRVPPQASLFSPSSLFDTPRHMFW